MNYSFFVFFMLMLFVSACSPEPATEPTASHQLPNDEDPVKETKEVPQKITFQSLDGLKIHAHLYEKEEEAPVMVLCHQARFNKMEYMKSAKTLMDKGYTCLAIDQRSGGPLIEFFNETQLEAKAKGKPTEFLDAEQDVIAAVNYAAQRFKKPVILLGSSYSSTIALKVAAENDNVQAVIAFSPGNYFAEENPDYEMTKVLATLKNPCWLLLLKKKPLR